MNRLFHGELLIKSVKLIFILAVFLLFANGSLRAATSPDAIAFRVMPNPDYLSPLRWYQENIKVKGSPQALTVDGYEAVRDGRTVYVNAANIYLPNDPVNNKFYTNIYIISYNQQAESSTVDIFGQLLSHWKFNKDFLMAGKCVQPDKFLSGDCLVDGECKTGEYCDSQKAKIIRDTRRLSDLAEIKFILEAAKKAPTDPYPQLASGSYLANTSISVWPSWKNTLAVALKSPLPIDPLNRLGVCEGYDKTTCWDPVNKRFDDQDLNNNQLDFPSCSFVYVYTAKNNAAYTLCALMESGFVSTESPDACPGSAPAPTGREQTCTHLTWTPDYRPEDICDGKTVTETDNCGNTKTVIGSKQGDNAACAVNTCVGRKCDDGCNMIEGTKLDTIWTSSVPLDQVCNDKTITQTGDCGGTRQVNGTKCCNICNAANQPNCLDDSASAPTDAVENTSGCCPAGQTCYKCSDNYTWDGTSCVGNPCNLWGRTILSGQSVRAFQANSVSFGSSCQDEQRECLAGRLSGSYQFQSCASVSPRSCSLWGRTIPHDQSVTAYQASSVACGLTCPSLTRTCYDGTLSGNSDYKYESCTVGSTVTLNNINNATIYTHPTGVTATLYKTPIQFSVTVSVSTPDPVTFTMTGNPNWLQLNSINSTSATIVGEQTNNDASSHAITVTATNSCGNQDSKQFTLNVVKNEWCGDSKKNGTEQCDPTDIDSSTGFSRSLTCKDPPRPSGLPSHCASVTVFQGARECIPAGDINQCTWDTDCVAEPIIEKTATACDLLPPAPMPEYACCMLTACEQDGCGCCGFDPDPEMPGYAIKQSMNSTWNSSRNTYNTYCGGAPSPSDPSKYLCQDCFDNYKTTPSPSTQDLWATNACQLGKSTSPVAPNDWYILINHATAYFKCWK